MKLTVEVIDMAKIVLSPGEDFSHFHDHVSQTELESGAAILSMDSKELKLEVGVSVEVPPNLNHIIRNTGAIEAVIRCYHVRA